MHSKVKAFKILFPATPFSTLVIQEAHVVNHRAQLLTMSFFGNIFSELIVLTQEPFVLQ